MDSKTTNDFLAINSRKTVCQNSVEGAFSYDFCRCPQPLEVTRWAPCEEVRNMVSLRHMSGSVALIQYLKAGQK